MTGGQIVATFNGYSIGVTDESGVRIRCAAVRGWWGAVGSAGQVEQRSAADGGWAGPAFRTPRQIEIDVELTGSSFEHVTPALDRLAAALPVRPAALTVLRGEDQRMSSVQLDGTFSPTRWAHTAAGTIPLIAKDPNRYSIVLHEASTGLPQTTGGLTVPFTVPFSVDAVSSSGVLLATNAGGAVTWPTFTLTGPVPAAARITHRETGASLYVPEAVAAGRSLVITTSPFNRGAVLDGTARRTVVGTFFGFAPGDNSVAFTAPTYDPDALLTATWRDADR